MRLLVVGRLSGQLAKAVKMAMAHGAKVSHVERGDQAMKLRRGGFGHLDARQAVEHGDDDAELAGNRLQ